MNRHPGSYRPAVLAAALAGALVGPLAHLCLTALDPDPDRPGAQPGNYLDYRCITPVHRRAVPGAGGPGRPGWVETCRAAGPAPGVEPGPQPLPGPRPRRRARPAVHRGDPAVAGRPPGEPP